jgi:hypothetical protein
MLRDFDLPGSWRQWLTGFRHEDMPDLRAMRAASERSEMLSRIRNFFGLDPV